MNLNAHTVVITERTKLLTSFLKQMINNEGKLRSSIWKRYEVKAIHETSLAEETHQLATSEQVSIEQANNAVSSGKCNCLSKNFFHLI